MITLQQFGIRLTALLDDLTEAAFAALAWIEEDDRQPAAGPDQARAGAPRKSAPRRRLKSRRQPQWSGSRRPLDDVTPVRISAPARGAS